MNFVVCPNDGERVKVVSAERDPGVLPIVQCPRCSKTFVFAAGALTPITEPEPESESESD